MQMATSWLFITQCAKSVCDHVCKLLCACFQIWVLKWLLEGTLMAGQRVVDSVCHQVTSVMFSTCQLASDTDICQTWSACFRFLAIFLLQWCSVSFCACQLPSDTDICEAWSACLKLRFLDCFVTSVMFSIFLHMSASFSCGQQCWIVIRLLWNSAWPSFP